MAANDRTLKCIRKQVLAVEQGHSITNFSMALIDDDPYHYQATMFGPTDSPFEERLDKLYLETQTRFAEWF